MTQRDQQDRWRRQQDQGEERDERGDRRERPRTTDDDYGRSNEHYGERGRSREMGRGGREGPLGDQGFDQRAWQDQGRQGRDAGGEWQDEGQRWGDRPTYSSSERYGGSPGAAGYRDAGMAHNDRFGGRDTFGGASYGGQGPRTGFGDRYDERGGYGGDTGFDQGLGLGGGMRSGQGGVRSGQATGSSTYDGPYGRGGDDMAGPHAGRGPKGYQRSDERVREEVCELLTRHGAIDASEIEISVQSGEVTLTGHVDSRQTRRRVEEVIENLPGVREVHNQLRIQGQGGQMQGQQGGQMSGERSKEIGRS